MSFRAKYIKFTQQASVAIPSGATSAIYTIPQAVVMANTLLFENGWNADSLSSFNIAGFRLIFLSTTTVQVDRGEDNQAYAMSCRFTITEFYGGLIRNLQRGTLTIPLGGFSNSVTLTRNANYNYSLCHLGSVDDFDDKLSLSLSGTTLTVSDARGSAAFSGSDISYQYYEM